MKRSEMVTLIMETMINLKYRALDSWKEEADHILNVIEKAGMSTPLNVFSVEPETSDGWKLRTVDWEPEDENLETKEKIDSTFIGGCR